MHELALADAVIDAVEKNLGGRDPSSVKRVLVMLGELQNIDLEIFEHGLKTLLEGKAIDYRVFSIEIEEAAFLCNNCGESWKLSEQSEIDEEEREAIHFLPEMAHVYMSCPNCGSRDFTLESGRGVSIAEIEFDMIPK